jgi:hypothetical protein
MPTRSAWQQYRLSGWLHADHQVLRFLRLAGAAQRSFNCGRADATVLGPPPPCPSTPGQARVAVDEDEHGGPDRETDNNDHP